MQRIYSAFLIILVTILSGFALSGCGGDNGTAPAEQIVSTNPQENTTLEQIISSTKEETTLIEQKKVNETNIKIGTSVLEGIIHIDATPKDRTIKLLNARSIVFAYNLDDKREYKLLLIEVVNTH